MGCNESNASKPIQPSNNVLKDTPSILPNQNELVVATLNYCGIMNSPFEFYCDDYLVELQDLSKQFIGVLPTYFPEFDAKTFKFQMGKIDLKYRTRYSPMFTIEAGIENNKFITRSRYQQLWEKQFLQQMPKLNVPYTQSEKEVAKKYDIAMFHCLLKYVYKIVKLEEAVSLEVKKYYQKLKPFYNLSFLDEVKKSEKVMNSLDKINADVFFFQEYSENFYQKVKKTGKYHITNDKSKDTLILAKKSSFTNIPANTDIIKEKYKITDELWNKLDCAERTSFMSIDKYFFICVHLTSKAEKNLPQIKKLREALTTLKSLVSDYSIVLAGDLNSFWIKEGNQVNIFPETQEWTTIKKRTATQGQFHKANKIICESKDKIITTLPILKGEITYINGDKPHKENLVPTNQHPFDHFVLVSHLERKKIQ